jgi:hypothetical protein
VGLPKIVELFLATQDRRVPMPGFTVSATDWRKLARDVGIPCPDALALLGDATMSYSIVFWLSSAALGGEAEETPFEMLAPSSAREVYAWHSEKRRDIEVPEAAPYMTMLPFANADGDALLIDTRGAVHWLPFTLPGRARQVAESIDDLLASILRAPDLA